MDVVVTSAGMRACDRHAIDRHAVPPILLMENAGRDVAAVVAAEIRRSGGVDATVVCGPGNNGGDGFVAARHLLAGGFRVRVVLVASASRLKGDTRTNFAILRKLRDDPSHRERLSISCDPTGGKLTARQEAGVVVDALLGTGFHGTLEGPILRAVRWINRLRGRKVAIDVPTGLHADNGRIGGECVRADVTVTMGHLKAGLLTGNGPGVCGRVDVAGLGVPLSIPDAGADKIWRIVESDVRAVMPVRPFNAHKHSVGKVLVLAGSVGFTGAAALCAEAAMRAGAGAVILAVPEPVYPVLSRKLTEVMVKPAQAGAEGTLTADSLDALETDLSWADVILAGPGIGRSPEIVGFLERLLRSRRRQYLFDADALNALSENPALAARLKRNTCILTPHAGEFSRLTGLTAQEVENDRVASARAFAVSRGVTLVLKGAPTVTATPKGTVFINTTGNPGMASAGMGDVLAGLIAGLWAGSADPSTAAWSGVFLHGMAGDGVEKSLGQRSLLAGDVLSRLSHVLKS